MSHDPYGFESATPPAAPPASAGSGMVAGVNVAIWGGIGLVYCLGCTGIFVPTYEPDAGDGLTDMLGVWTILMVPAYPMFGVAFATLALHAVTRRWWSSAGPNIIIGGCAGLAVWVAVLFAVVCAGLDTRPD